MTRESPPREPFPPAADGGGSSASGDRPHVVVIEDDESMRLMLGQALREQGYRVTECADAFRWMDYCVGEGVDDAYAACDLVISDIRLPGISGLDVLEGLRHSRRNPPVILITAFGDEQTHRRAKVNGACAVLDKPFATRELVELVREYCARKPQGGAGPAEDDEQP